MLFCWVIRANQIVFFEWLLPWLSLSYHGLNLGILLLPALGGLIAGPIIHKVALEAKGHGVPEVMEAAFTKGGSIRARVAAIKVMVSSTTIGSGGSAGREGPIAQIGASIGSSLGQLFKLSSHDIRLLTICGVAAGIGGTFNAPLGGVLFGLEVVFRHYTLVSAVPVLLAAIVGTSVATVFLGSSPLSPAFTTKPFVYSIGEIPFYLILGLVFGVVAFLWVRAFYSLESLFDRLPMSGRWKLALGGLATGSIGMLLLPYYHASGGLPTSFGLLGVGYDGLELILAGSIPLLLLLLLGLLKVVTTSSTIGSGGSGGIFSPSLYIGAAFGGVLGTTFRFLFPEIIKQPYAYSLAGMAALFSETASAPLMSIVMIPEMCHDWALLPPIMASSATSYLVSRWLLKGSSIYTLKLERRGIPIVKKRGLLEMVPVKEIMTERVITVGEHEKTAKLLELVSKYGHPTYPVINSKGKIVGLAGVNAISKLGPEEMTSTPIAEILNRRVLKVHPDDTVQTALETMRRNNVERLLVVDESEPRILRGVVTKLDVIHAYVREERELEEDLLSF